MSAPLLVLLVVVASCVRAPGAAFPEIGAAETLDIATWNVERFGNDAADPDDALQVENVQRVIRNAGIDVWALQEIEDRRDFARLMEGLGPDWDAIVDESGTNLHLAFVFRKSAVRVRDVGVILESQARAFASRPPLRLTVDVTIGPERRTLSLINLHLKAFEDEASWNRRLEAAQILKRWLDEALAESPVIVLGDFNDGVIRSIRQGAASPFSAFTVDADSYRFTTTALEERGEGTYCFRPTCTSGSVVDHVLITDELFDAIQGEAVRYDALLQVVDRYVTTTSDHLPAVVRLDPASIP